MDVERAWGGDCSAERSGTRSAAWPGHSTWWCAERKSGAGCACCANHLIRLQTSPRAASSGVGRFAHAVVPRARVAVARPLPNKH